QLSFHRLHNRQLARTFALENSAGIDAGLTVHVGKSCRANDLPAERISNWGGSDQAKARLIVHGHVGHRSQKIKLLKCDAASTEPLLLSQFHSYKTHGLDKPTTRRMRKNILGRCSTYWTG